MKYLSLSFDDGRSDTYNVAFSILKQYGLPATVNIISDFVLHPDKYSFESASQPMTKDQIVEWQNASNEVASHGSTHHNSKEDIIKSIEEMMGLGINVINVGFASPESEVTEANVKALGISELKDSGKISYIRSGIQVRREGGGYTLVSLVERITHSINLYWSLNKNSILRPKELPYVLPSAAVKSYHTTEQIINFVDRIPDGSAIIIMLHSILRKSDEFYGADNYYWDAERFEIFCQYLKSNQNIKVVTTLELVNLFEK